MNASGAASLTSRLARTACLSFVLLLVLVSSAPVRPSTAAELTGDASFGELAATPNFPNTIDFQLTAAASEEIVRAELLFAPRWEETLNLIEAEVTPGRELQLTFPLDMYQNYFPPGLDLLYRWRLTDVAGRVSISEERTVLWMDTRFTWTEIATDQVSVSFYTGDEVFNREILDAAQQTIDRLQTEFGVERSRPIRIWVYNSADEFGGAQEPNSETWIAGASYPGRYLILAVIPDGNGSEVARVIPHEVSHQVFYQATENPFNLPARWLDEGLATYHQGADKEGYSVVLETAVNEGQLLPLPSLTADFPFDDTYRLAYAEGLSVVELILAVWGEEALGRVVAAYREGVSHDEALQRGIGLTTAELDSRWKESLDYPGDQPLDDGTGGATTSGGSSDRGPGDWWLSAAAGLVLVLAADGAGVARRRHRRLATPDLLAA